MRRRNLAATLALLIGCGGGAPDPVGDDDGGDDDGGSSTVDPFAPQPDTSEGLVDVSADLDEVLEHGALEGACDASEADPGDRRKRLLCGKAMFFHEGFGTIGVPRPLLDWLLEHFPDEVGPGFAAVGMIADPATGLPLGLPPGAPLGDVETLAFGCASCHFGRLPDGRYAVGAPNHAYDYGRMNLMLTMLPALAIPGSDPADHDPDAIAAIQPLRDRMAANPEIQTALIEALLPLITGGGGMLPEFDAANEHWYANWRTGTMDFFIQPLPFDDEVHTVSKISSLWGLPDADERAAHGLASAHLGWTGGTSSLENFAAGFVDLGGGDIDAWPAERLAPLVEYVYTLRAPEPPTPSGDVERGRAVFAEACLDCHGGPRGMGHEVYTYEEIGTDDEMRWWADGPDHDGEPCCGLRFQPGDTMTGGIKSPRLVGLWAMTRFLHNGALDSLEQLLCVEPRPGVSAPAFGDGGHTYGCDLDDADRAALLAYLRAH
jgi:mono/diheme cytochrome c family protein